MGAGEVLGAGELAGRAPANMGLGEAPLGRQSSVGLWLKGRHGALEFVRPFRITLRPKSSASPAEQPVARWPSTEEGYAAGSERLLRHGVGQPAGGGGSGERPAAWHALATPHAQQGGRRTRGPTDRTRVPVQKAPPSPSLQRPTPREASSVGEQVRGEGLGLPQEAHAALARLLPRAAQPRQHGKRPPSGTRAGAQAHEARGESEQPAVLPIVAVVHPKGRQGAHEGAGEQSGGKRRGRPPKGPSQVPAKGGVQDRAESAEGLAAGGGAGLPGRPAAVPAEGLPSGALPRPASGHGGKGGPRSKARKQGEEGGGGEAQQPSKRGRKHRPERAPFPAGASGGEVRGGPRAEAGAAGLRPRSATGHPHAEAAVQNSAAAAGQTGAPEAPGRSEALPHGASGLVEGMPAPVTRRGRPRKPQPQPDSSSQKPALGSSIQLGTEALLQGREAKAAQEGRWSNPPEQLAPSQGGQAEAPSDPPARTDFSSGARARGEPALSQKSTASRRGGMRASSKPKSESESEPPARLSGSRRKEGRGQREQAEHSEARIRAAGAEPREGRAEQPVVGRAAGRGMAQEHSRAKQRAEGEGDSCETEGVVHFLPQPGETVMVVDSEAGAREVVQRLLAEHRHKVHACDTEVANIDVKKESPVGHGEMVCFSIYCGPGVDFGHGHSRIWVDVLGERRGLLEIFRPYFEDPGIRMVWHNYSFDRHILQNHGIKPAGFHADTMHLARLFNTARKGTDGGYSLEALTRDPKVMNGRDSCGLRDVWEDETILGAKTSMKDLFGVPQLKKDGKEGKIKVVPPVEQIQVDPAQRDKWIEYSVHDAVSTWVLWRSLERKLTDRQKEPWHSREAHGRGTLYDLYQRYWQPFAEVLIDMEREGMLVDRQHLATMEQQARQQQEMAERSFRLWARQYCPDALYMNVGSDPQIRQLLFGGCWNSKKEDEKLNVERTFSVPNTEGFIEEGRKAPKKKRSITLRKIGAEISVEVFTTSGWPAVSGKVLKSLAGKLAYDYTSSNDGSDSEGPLGGSDSELEDDLADGAKSSQAEEREQGGPASCRAATEGGRASTGQHAAAGEGFPLGAESALGAQLAQQTAEGTEGPQEWLSAMGGLDAVWDLKGQAAEHALSQLGGYHTFLEEIKRQQGGGSPGGLEEAGAAQAALRGQGEQEAGDLGQAGMGADGGGDRRCAGTAERDASGIGEQALEGASSVTSEGNPGGPEGGSERERASEPAQAAPSEPEDLSMYGKAYDAFGGGEKGKEACRAFAALCEVASINTLLSNFILPLQGNDIVGPEGRVHCSLNINTETGRLSARKPSLQNQPALQKDRYRIRQAFRAEEGNTLIVADYGQLELRLLAHLADCKSMLEAFRAGGDFHSRTALNMYPHVREAIERGDVVLEWEPRAEQPKPSVPLLKDRFRSERQKAKMLNFSIAYGKTARGLAKDWEVSPAEAEATLQLWYRDRPEVQRWQQERIAEAKRTLRVHTLLGRPRHLPGIRDKERFIAAHFERAAINSPVQGSAADVAMLAMLRIAHHAELRDLGFKLLLQVHDEVILEGPQAHVERAQAIVVDCMERPFPTAEGFFPGDNPLLVDLAVDADNAPDWYSAK